MPCHGRARPTTGSRRSGNSRRSRAPESLDARLRGNDIGKMSAASEKESGAGEHVLGDDGRFHAVDEEVRLSVYGWEDWIVLAVFWALAAVVFYQVFTRSVLTDAAGWTEEIARYLLVAVTFLGGAMAVRR